MRLSKRLFLLLLGAFPATLAPQSRKLSLRPEFDSLAESFSRITGVRELADGRVLVTDDIDNKLVVADFRAGHLQSIGRVGSGPGEFRLAGRLFALPGDSTLFIDGLNSRWLLLAGSRVVATSQPTDRSVQMAGFLLSGADAEGRVLGSQPLPGVLVTEDRRRAMAALVRVNRRTLVVDTVARVRGADMVMRTVGAPRSGQVRAMSVVFSVPDQGVLFPDGWIAVVLQDPYRVDWYTPAGRHIRGAPIPWQPPRMSDKEKHDWRDRTERVSGSPLSISLSQLVWADVIPPFRDDALVAAPGNVLLVLRSQW